MKFSCPVSVYQAISIIRDDTPLPPLDQSESILHLDQSVLIDRIKLRWQERLSKIDTAGLLDVEAPWKAHTVDILVHTETVDRIAL